MPNATGRPTEASHLRVPLREMQVADSVPVVAGIVGRVKGDMRVVAENL
jgi:hypothetical protein